jgi:predicted Mrr-cat superfamily restriction endonuclease
MTRKLWVIRPEANFNNRIDEFLARGMVAIGWPGVGSLAESKTRDDIKAVLCRTYEHYSKDDNNELAVAAGILDRFVNQVSPRDVILVPDGNEVYVCEVKGDYAFHQELAGETPDQGFPHWREVTYMKDGKPFCLIKDLPLGVRRAIDCKLTVFAITSAAGAMWTYLGMEAEEG